MERLLKMYGCAFVFFFFLCGCARIPVAAISRQEVDSLKSRVDRLEALIADREKELAAVREILLNKDEALRQKDSRIDQMRKQLESVGIFGG